MNLQNLMEVKTSKFVCPKLKFDISGLEPYLSQEVIHYHYDKRTKTYYKKTNELIKGTIFENKQTLKQILQSKGKALKDNSKLYHNAAQAWNHTFFFDNLNVHENCGQPLPQITELLPSKKDIFEQAMDQFASGWLWVIKDGDKLVVETTNNADTPICQDRSPILTIDLWEHAHELDYPADRKRYLENVWQVIDWNVVNQRFEQV